MPDHDVSLSEEGELVPRIASLCQEVSVLIEQQAWQELILRDQELLLLIQRVFDGSLQYRLQTEQIESLHACLQVLLSGIERAKLARSHVTEQFSKSKQARSAAAAYDRCKK
ncbi:MAG: hypothetical protein Q9N68_01965 [Gammaproteobacteria bacterium]|nr:hypothetical protein [Gammaproteobacteria bacterium]